MKLTGVLQEFFFRLRGKGKRGSQNSEGAAQARGAGEFQCAIAASIVESSEDAIIGRTLEGAIVSWNHGAEQLYGYSEQEALGKHISLIFPSYLPDELRSGLERLKRGERIPSFDTARVTRNGTLLHVSVTLSPIRDSRGTVIGASSIARDITEKKRSAAALRESESRFRRLSETIAAGVFIYHDSQFQYVNRTAERITGYSRRELLNMDFWDLIHPEFKEPLRRGGLACAAARKSLRYEMKIVTKSGRERWLDLTTGPIAFKGRPAGLATAFDITERKRAEEWVQHLAVHDPLTDLANYRRLMEALDSEIKRSERSGREFALLLLDMDGLKRINDSHGHLVGSRALCRLAGVLRYHSRSMDTAARYGGDEFALILPETQEPAARQVAARIAERLGQDQEFPKLAASIGVALYPRDGRDLRSLMASADLDLYGDKAQHARFRMAQEELERTAGLYGILYPVQPPTEVAAAVRAAGLTARSASAD